MTSLVSPTHAVIAFLTLAVVAALLILLVRRVRAHNHTHRLPKES